MLLSGNGRYVSGGVARPHQDTARRTELAAAQKPFAIVLTCSDSRAAPEILFDQGLGDIYVVRTAGNVADDVALGSKAKFKSSVHSTLWTRAPSR